MKAKLLLVTLLTPLWLLGSATLFETIEQTDVGIGGYTLGKTLSGAQKEIATQNAQKANIEGTYKFTDGMLNIVADAKNDRVVLIYKAYDKLDNEMLKGVVGSYIGEYEEPTTITHNNIIYWFYDAKGAKITLDEFEAWRSSMQPPKHDGPHAQNVSADKKPLGQMVMVKLSSNKPFNGEKAFSDGTAYLIISSEALLTSNYTIKH